MGEPPEDEPDICTVLRGIYHRSEDPEIRTRARIATAMAKKVQMRLKEFKQLFCLGGD